MDDYTKDKYYKLRVDEMQKAVFARGNSENQKFAKLLTIGVLMLAFLLFFISPGLLVIDGYIAITGKDVDTFSFVFAGFLVSIPIFLTIYFWAGRVFKRSLIYYSLMCVATSACVYYISEQRNADKLKPRNVGTITQPAASKDEPVSVATEPVPASEPTKPPVEEASIPSVEIIVSAPKPADELLSMMLTSCADANALRELIPKVQALRKPNVIDAQASKAELAEAERILTNETVQLSMEKMRKAIELDETNSDAYNHLSNFHALQKNFSTAEDLIVKGLIFLPDDASLWYRLGEIYGLAGKTNAGAMALVVSYQLAISRAGMLGNFKNQIETSRPGIKAAAEQALIIIGKLPKS